ncbi:MAG TPA: hypothetical protein VIL99_15805 [Ignavibacteria bacterium]
MKQFLLILISISLITFNFIKADGGDDGKKKADMKSKASVEKFLRDYKLAKKEFNYKTNKLIDFYVDFQLGVAGTNANITSAANTGEYKTTSKLGYTTGALFYLNLFNMVSFSSGLTFDGRSFGVTTPSVIPPNLNDSSFKSNNTSYFTSNYLDIPLNFNIGGMLTEKFGLWFNGGPYLGILLNSPNNLPTGMGYKNFDLGLNGTLTANYVFAYPLSVILGTSFKYGGLNNLGSTKLVDKITTTNYSFFTGLRLSF